MPLCARRADTKYFFAGLEHILGPMLRMVILDKKHKNEEAVRLVPADVRLLFISITKMALVKLKEYCDRP
ncbi:hypothetical protein ABH999_000824 [Bradyrhizobium yuanmingense]|uniref:hypothetical protein n=1 Tax=Bradyrhizobium yuanmingense TaxID=108015 RepID=UPI003511D5D7